MHLEKSQLYRASSCTKGLSWNLRKEHENYLVLRSNCDLLLLFKRAKLLFQNFFNFRTNYECYQNGEGMKLLYRNCCFVYKFSWVKFDFHSDWKFQHDKYDFHWTFSIVITEIIWNCQLIECFISKVVSKDQKSLGHKISSWFQSIWNRFDLMMYLLFIVSIILRCTLGESNFVWARNFYSCTVACFYLRLMHSFYVSKNVGPKIIMIKKMVCSYLNKEFWLAIVFHFFFVCCSCNYPS